MRIIQITLITLALITLAVSSESFAHNNASNKSRVYPENSGTETDAGKVISQFHKAIKKGHKKKARSLLADDIIIFEGGRVERSADDYANHHMLADMEYLAKIHTQVLEHSVQVNGDTAYSMSRTKSSGQFKGKYVNSEGMESMVLQKKDGEWKIVHIHWSH